MRGLKDARWLTSQPELIEIKIVDLMHMKIYRLSLSKLWRQSCDHMGEEKELQSYQNRPSWLSILVSAWAYVACACGVRDLVLVVMIDWVVCC